MLMDVRVDGLVCPSVSFSFPIIKHYEIRPGFNEHPIEQLWGLSLGDGHNS